MKRIRIKNEVGIQWQKISKKYITLTCSKVHSQDTIVRVLRETVDLVRAQKRYL